MHRYYAASCDSGVGSGTSALGGGARDTTRSDLPYSSSNIALFSRMASHFQVAPLVASPFYSNSVVWSEENLLAIATGHLVTILNPAQLDGPRGMITISASPPFDIGVVEKEDLLTGCILPTCLSRDVRSYVRSIAWSQQGMAPNGGCLLAVCTTDSRVKLYRAPYCDFRAEWVEVLDISEMLYNYFVTIQFGESELGFAGISPERTVSVDGPFRDIKSSNSVQEARHRKAVKTRKISAHSDTIDHDSSYDGSQASDDDLNEESSVHPNKRVTFHTRCTLMPWAAVEEGASVEVLKTNGSLRFWVRGRIERLEDRKALVQFTGTSADEMQEEWVAVDLRVDGKNDSKASEDVTSKQNYFLQKIRPCINAGNLPKGISMATYTEGSEQVPMNGQLVEAWISNRWVEGSFVGFNGTGLMVNFPGEYGCVLLDPDNVRLAPIWNGEHKSWRITVVEPDLQVKKVSQNGLVVVKDVTDLGKSEFQETLVKSSAKATRKRSRNDLSCVISADQYASRSGLLASLIVAWSPTVKPSLEVSSLGSSSSCSAILAVGAKSGKVSLWRVLEPQFYAIEHCLHPPEVRFIGLLQAHKSWVTAASWAICSVNTSGKMDVDSSTNKLLLATGSSDGNVRLWYGDPVSLSKSSATSSVPLCLLKDVVSADSVPVSAVSLVVPPHSPDKVLVAIGKGSGLLSVWICYTSGRKCHKAGHYEAHDQVVTGLAWAFDGHCLYSCSQDNSVRSWIMHGSSLLPVPFPDSSPGLALENPKNAMDLPSYVFDCCFGLAVSPGNLVITAIRSIDTDLVDPMYQSRSQKAAAQFFWIGGQQMKSSLGKLSECRSEMYGGFSEKEVVCWESNVLWSLRHFEDVSKPLVLWDVLMALLALKVLTLNLFETILSKWLSSWFSGSRQACALERCLIHLPRLLSKAICRRIHLLVIICRRLLLSDMKTESLSSGLCDVDKKETVDRREQLKAWTKLLQSSEHELRERLVYFTLSAISCRASYLQPVCHLGKTAWVPAGAPQMEKWVSLNTAKVPDPLKQLAGQIRELGRKRVACISEYAASERCTFCNASVQFKSPEVAYCQAGRCNSDSQSHKLQRCAVSMQVCPAVPLWFCICCERWALKQAPDMFFHLSSLQDVKYLSEHFLLRGCPKPLCPFCGILMQRLLPEFLLTSSPV